MAGSIQFRGVDQVMQAFENRDVEAWSVWQHRQFMFKGIGSGDLRTLLDNLAVGSTNAIYTIKIFEDVKTVKEIKEKTECDGSFNFRLDSDQQEMNVGQITTFNRNNSLLNRLTAIEEKLNNPPAEDEDEEEETIGSVLIDVVKNPDKAMKWAEVIRNIFNPSSSTPVRQLPVSQQQQPAAMGNVENANQTFTEEQLERLDKATDILFAKDPKLVDHLEMLARIAVDKPKKFQSLLTMLELF